MSIVITNCISTTNGVIHLCFKWKAIGCPNNLPKPHSLCTGYIGLTCFPMFIGIYNAKDTAEISLFVKKKFDHDNKNFLFQEYLEFQLIFKKKNNVNYKND